MKNISVKLPVSTSDGTFIAQYSENGLMGLAFPTGGKKGVRPVNAKQIPLATLRWHRTTAQALKFLLAGKVAPEIPPLDWAAGTVFQKSVWQEMLKIPAGQTKSYGEVAKAIGKPKAVRAVGGACGANPIPVLVPCHRILAANNKIGGFSGGLEWKRKLLAREGIQYNDFLRSKKSTKRD